MEEARKIVDTGEVSNPGLLTGACVFPVTLDYFDMLSGFPIPVYHKLLLGVHKSFAITCLEGLNGEGEFIVNKEHSTLMTWRLQQLMPNLAVDTKIIDIVNHR